MSEETKAAKSYVDGVVHITSADGDVEYSTTDGGTEQMFIPCQLPTGEVETVILFMSEKAMPYTADKIAALGYNGKGKVGPQINGAKCRLAISFEMWEGKERKRVDLVKQGGGGLKAKNPATQSQAAQMQSKLERAVASLGDFPAAPIAAAAPSVPPKLF